MQDDYTRSSAPAPAPQARCWRIHHSVSLPCFQQYWHNIRRSRVGSNRRPQHAHGRLTPFFPFREHGPHNFGFLRVT